MPSYRITLTVDVHGIKTQELAERIADEAVDGLPQAVLGNRVPLIGRRVEKVQIINNVDSGVGVLDNGPVGQER